MRHAVRGRKLARTSAHRLALRRNLVQSLFEHGEIRTTITKAKEFRGFADQLIQLAIDGGLAARQRAIALLNDRAIIPKEHRAEYDRMTDVERERALRSRSGRRYRATRTTPRAQWTAESVIHRLFAHWGPLMKRRNEAKGSSGGYTRIIKLSERRLSDGTQMCLFRLVAEDDVKRPKLERKTERKRRAAVKYSFYAGKPIQRRGARRPARPAGAESAPAAE